MIDKQETTIEITETPALEQWQVEAVAALLSVPVKELDDGRHYSHSEQYGTNIYHIVNELYSSTQIVQNNTDEKWPGKIVIQDDQLPEFINVLLKRYLNQKKPQSNDFLLEEPDELIDHPF